MSEYVPVQTSVPDWLMTYCRQLADVHHGRRLNRMHVFMLESFLRVEPWKANPPLEFRQARVHGSSGLRARNGTDYGWAAMNMMLPAALAERVRHAVEVINHNGYTHKPVSLRSFLFTAVYWWCTYVYPYEGPGLVPD